MGLVQGFRFRVRDDLCGGTVIWDCEFHDSILS
jgi:hypothetical protein